MQPDDITFALRVLSPVALFLLIGGIVEVTGRILEKRRRQSQWENFFDHE